MSGRSSGQGEDDEKWTGSQCILGVSTQVVNEGAGVPLEPPVTVPVQRQKHQSRARGEWPPAVPGSLTRLGADPRESVGRGMQTLGLGLSMKVWTAAPSQRLTGPWWKERGFEARCLLQICLCINPTHLLLVNASSRPQFPRL